MTTNEYTLTAGDAAEQLGCGLSTIARWADRGYVRYVRTPGGWRKFRQADIDRLVSTLKEAS